MRKKKIILVGAYTMGELGKTSANFESIEVRVPWLIQRIFLRKEPCENRSGVDRWFTMDYMGSAEFEFGALAKALKSIRSNKDRYLEEPRKIKLSSDEVAWYVGSEDYLEIAEQVFADQLRSRQLRFKERTQIAEAYNDRSYLYTESDQMGWWAIDATFPWLLFKKKISAQKWLTLM